MRQLARHAERSNSHVLKAYSTRRELNRGYSVARPRASYQQGKSNTKKGTEAALRPLFRLLARAAGLEPTTDCLEAGVAPGPHIWLS